MKKYFLLFLFVLVGCETTAEFERRVKQIEEKMYSDLFSSYYTSEKNLPDVNTRLSGEEAAYYRIENLKQDSNKLLNDGYVLLGKLAFTDNLAEDVWEKYVKEKRQLMYVFIAVNFLIRRLVLFMEMFIR